MKISSLMIALLAIFAVALAGCSKGGGGATPKEAVEGMMEAMKTNNTEKFVSYFDIGGAVAEAKKKYEEMTKDMPEEQKKQMEKLMGDALDVNKAKAKMIESLKKEKAPEFTYKILEVKDEKADSATVVVEITEKGKEAEKQEFPVKKVGNKWMASMPEIPMETPTIETPTIPEDVKETVEEVKEEAKEAVEEVKEEIKEKAPEEKTGE